MRVMQRAFPNVKLCQKCHLSAALMIPSAYKAAIVLAGHPGQVLMNASNFERLGVLTMKKLLLASVALAALSAAPAFAADAIIEEPMLPVGFSWTGAYIGVQGGYAWGSSHMEFANVTSNPDPDGFLGGVYVGYNYQLGNNIVLGVDADIAWTGIDGSDPVFAGGVVVPGQRIEADVDWTAAIRGRVGYAVDRFLPYIAGGVAFADVNHQGFIAPAVGVGEQSDTYTGWTIGAGLEYAFTDNLIVRGEYRYTDFGSEDYAAIPGFSAHSLDLSTHDVRIGLSYKF